MFTPEYKAAWNKCLTISREMFYHDIESPRRKELEKALELARAERKAIKAAGKHRV